MTKIILKNYGSNRSSSPQPTQSKHRRNEVEKSREKGEKLNHHGRDNGPLDSKRRRNERERREKDKTRDRSREKRRSKDRYDRDRNSRSSKEHHRDKDRKRDSYNDRRDQHNDRDRRDRRSHEHDRKSYRDDDQSRNREKSKSHEKSRDYTKEGQMSSPKHQNDEQPHSSSARQPQTVETRDDRSKFAMQKAEAINRSIERRANEKVQQLQKLGIEVPGISVPLQSPQPLLNIPSLTNLQLHQQQQSHQSLIMPSTATAPAAATAINADGSVNLSNFTNPLLNSTRYTEQLQKKKLIWGAKKAVENPTTNNWETAKFSQDQDGKVASKFLRLMGVKSTPKSNDEASGDDSMTDQSIQKREEMFTSMEQQYEMARQATHTMRGMGLGFGSSRPF